MQHFYDGQIRRYITQTIRVLSNFVVKYGDGTLVRVPVMYGDADKQVASIVRQNSENAVNSTPRMAVYISSFALDRSRLGDATHVGKIHIREREVDYTDPANPFYTGNQGKNYTVERLMPTPFKLTLKCDIWAANTDQKLQILEQILMLFNPSLELQTSDNYIDWTSLTVLELNDVTWSSRPVPQATGDAIDIATLTLETPVWLSPPAKVKHLGVITNIITSMYETADTSWAGVDGLGPDLVAGGTTTMSSVMSRDRVTINNFGLQVYNKQAVILNPGENVLYSGSNIVGLEIPIRQGVPKNWKDLLDQYPGQFVSGSSRIYLTQPTGAEVWGQVALHPTDETILVIDNWVNTQPSDDLMPHVDGVRANGLSADSFDAIIDPTKVYPEHGMEQLDAGDRFLIIEDILGNNQAWGTFTASANDIIEWDGFQWNIIFNAAQETDNSIYQTNKYTGVQYVWNGVMWAKSFEGEYKAGTWRLEL